MSEQLKSRIWLRSRPVSIIFDGVDLSSFRPIPREEARRKLGWKHDDKRVFFNLVDDRAEKRLALAESAVALAREEFPGLELVTATEIDPELIPFYMNACDCLLLTSKSEGSPTVVKEAIACNLPVVTVDVGDVKCLLKGVQPTRIVAADRNPGQRLGGDLPPEDALERLGASGGSLGTSHDRSGDRYSQRVTVLESETGLWWLDDFCDPVFQSPI